MANAKDVAEFMMKELKENECLYQQDVVYDIEEKFGEEFVYENDNGGLSIDKKVLAEFRKLDDKNVVYEKGQKMWRFRDDDDEEGKRGQY